MQLRKEYCEILPVKSATWDTVRSPEDAAGADDACCCASAISAAFLHSSSARLTSPDTAATCRDSLPQYTAYCQDGKGFSAHDTKNVHCRFSATSTAFLHSSSARLTSPDTAASCTDALPQYTAYCQDGSGFLAHDADSVRCSTLIQPIVRTVLIAHDADSLLCSAYLSSRKASLQKFFSVARRFWCSRSEASHTHGRPHVLKHALSLSKTFSLQYDCWACNARHSGMLAYVFGPQP